MNWETATFRSSAIGNLLTEPQSKAAKEAGELSETTKTYLISRYIELKYGRKTEIKSKYLERGKASEEDSVTMLSAHENEKFTKNEEQFANEWITGTPDLFRTDTQGIITEVLDIKTCWSLETLLSNIGKPLNTMYEAQMQCYMALTNSEIAWVCYCLPDFDFGFIESEKLRLLNSMNVATEENIEYRKACAELDKQFTFGDIPLFEKILKFPVYRNEEMIQKIYRRVEKSRDFLADFEYKHQTFNL